MFSNPLTAGLKPIKSGLSIPCRSPSGDDHTDLSRQTRYQSFIDGHPDRTIIAPVLAQSRNKFFHSRSPSFGMAFFLLPCYGIGHSMQAENALLEERT